VFLSKDDSSRPFHSTQSNLWLLLLAPPQRSSDLITQKSFQFLDQGNRGVSCAVKCEEMQAVWE